MTRYIGVDFSGARNGGRLCWLATIDGGGLVESIFPAAALPASGATPASFVPALVAFLAGRRDAVVGIDAPFSLPAGLIDAADWPAFVGAFAARHPTPAAFRDACRCHGELRRRTDREARTPFAAYNLRLYRQSWWAIAQLLAPLAALDHVAIAPMQPVAGAAVILVETCPASALKRRGLYRPYKGRGRDAARAEIVEALEIEGVRLQPVDRSGVIADAGGDRLDAVIAAMTAWQIPADALVARDAVDALEARVYF